MPAPSSRQVQDTGFSTRQQGFESPWGYCIKALMGGGPEQCDGLDPHAGDDRFKNHSIVNNSLDATDVFPALECGEVAEQI